MELLMLDEDNRSYAVVVDKECLGEVIRNGKGYNWTSYKTLSQGHSLSLPKAIHRLSLIASLYGSFRAVCSKKAIKDDDDLGILDTLCFGQTPVVELGKAMRYFESLLSSFPQYYIMWSRGGKRVQVWDRRKLCWVDVRG